MERLAILFVFVICTAAALAFNEHEHDIEERLIGGLPAQIGQFPYQVSLRSSENKHFCGGSILNQNWVLTTAACVYERPYYNITIVVGTIFLNSPGAAYSASQVIPHSGYNQQYDLNDIALIRVDGSIIFNKSVLPVVLPNTTLPGGASCVLSGWGSISYPSISLPNNLQYINLYSITITQCKSYLPYPYEIDSTNVCTYPGYGKGACQGDSGDPLVCQGVQHGILSWTVDCAKGNPDVFTSVNSYRSWIKSFTDF